jgi:hypothetical protein
MVDKLYLMVFGYSSAFLWKNRSFISYIIGGFTVVKAWNMTWSDPVWSGWVRLGLVCSSLVWFGLVCSGLP